MAILLRRNSQRDKYFTYHSKCINVGDIVALTCISSPTKDTTIKIYVPENHPDSFLNPFIASLNCFDYIRSSNHG